MRISDWSSDVCSSDLVELAGDQCAFGLLRRFQRHVVALEIGARIEHFLIEEASVKVCVEIVVMIDVVLSGERLVEFEQLAEQRADTPSLHATLEAVRDRKSVF